MKLTEAINIPLTESFDKVYPLRQETYDSWSFYDNNGYKYVIFIESYPGKRTGKLIYNIEFLVETTNGYMSKYDSYATSSKDNPIAIFSTVMSVVKGHINSHPTSSFGFSGDRKLGTLYKRLVEKNIDQRKYRVFTKMSGSHIDFCIVSENTLVLWEDDIVDDTFDMLDEI